MENEKSEREKEKRPLIYKVHDQSNQNIKEEEEEEVQKKKAIYV